MPPSTGPSRTGETGSRRSADVTRIGVVAGNPNAITYVSAGEAERRARAGAPLKLLPVSGVEATSRNIRSGNFPISRLLILVTKGMPAGLVKEFIEFSLSAQVH